MIRAVEFFQKSNFVIISLCKVLHVSVSMCFGYIFFVVLFRDRPLLGHQSSITFGLFSFSCFLLFSRQRPIYFISFLFILFAYCSTFSWGVCLTSPNLTICKVKCGFHLKNWMILSSSSLSSVICPTSGNFCWNCGAWALAHTLSHWER